MFWNGTTREKHNRKSALPDAQVDGWTAGDQDDVRSSILGRGFGLECLGIGFPAHALCERLRPLPRSAYPQPVGRRWRWTRLVASSLGKGVEDRRRSLQISPRIVDADQSSITCSPGASRHLIKACLAGERSTLRSSACLGKSSDDFRHSDG